MSILDVEILLNLPIEVNRKLKNSVDPPQKTTSKICAEKKISPKSAFYISKTAPKIR